METAINVVYLLFGGSLLYLGAEWLVKGSAGLARSLGVKPLIIGLTVVAYGTSAPELAVSSAAILEGSHYLVLGNVIGSCIANLGLILGVTALISPPTVDGRLIRRELPVIVLSVIAMPLVLLSGTIELWESGLLLGSAIAFTVYTLFVASDSVQDSPVTVDDTSTEGEPDTNQAASSNDGDEDDMGMLQQIVFTVVGLGLLVFGGEVFVDGAKGVALTLGMSEHLVGLTVVAMGTSLPELAASIVAALKGYSSMAVGNVIGSNIFNIFLILGVVGFIRPIEADVSALVVDLAFLGAITFIGVLFMRGERRISRFEGFILLGMYIGFIVMAAIGA